MKKRKERIAMRVIQGGMVPADGLSQSRLRERGYRVNDIVFAEFKKPRNPGYHRLAHQFGRMVAENIDDFTGMDAHKVLKRIQREAEIACEVLRFKIDGMLVEQLVPQSLSFESMEQGEFEEVYRAMCNHVSEKYWPDLSPEQIADMAELMAEAA